jgi:hypothetical protein
MSAATPDMCGVAMLVPFNSMCVLLPSHDPERLLNFAEQMRAPGAMISGFTV